ncbi:TPA: LOW QUALITY PROTEIN: hypothetical protein N0F65_009702, partial [Lagenidium giganteum]
RSKISEASTAPSSVQPAATTSDGHSTGSATQSTKNESNARPQNLLFRLTRLKSAPPKHNNCAVGISDLLAGDFTRVLLTNYMFDMAWLFDQCPKLHERPVLLVHGERDRAAMAAECKGFQSVTLVAPSLPIPYGTHHTKMMVVLYPAKVRVVICTANFIPIDWNNKTQGVWYQDFELKTIECDSDSDDASQSKTEASTDLKPKNECNEFEADLVDYLRALGPRVAEFARELHRFDFLPAEVALLPSIPGVHKGKDMHKYGHLKLRRVLSRYKNLSSDNPFICQFSSMGSLDEKWLFGEFKESFMPGCRSPSTASIPINNLHIIWPSVDDVKNSVEGWNAGRAVPCPLKNMKPFLHKYLRKWSPPPSLHRQNAMPHMKSYARFQTSPESFGVLDFAILTSSNLSKAAWGCLQKNNTQFMIRSYELGVLFLPQTSTTSNSQPDPSPLIVLGSPAAERAPPSARFLPLPYTFPPATYNPKTDEPWVWDLVREDPDIFVFGILNSSATPRLAVGQTPQRITKLLQQHPTPPPTTTMPLIASPHATNKKLTASPSDAIDHRPLLTPARLTIRRRSPFTGMASPATSIVAASPAVDADACASCRASTKRKRTSLSGSTMKAMANCAIHSGKKRTRRSMASGTGASPGKAQPLHPSREQHLAKSFVELEVSEVYRAIRKQTGALGGNAAGGAIYGEITQSSFQRVIDFMKENCEFSSRSLFVDVGSGLGKPNFHVAIDPGVEVSYGIELEELRWQLSLHNLRSVLTLDINKNKPNRTVFTSGDITHAKTLDPFTHIYSFDVGFPPGVMDQYAQIFNRSTAKFLASFHSPRKITEMYGFNVESIGRVNTSMAGSSEGHTCYFYRRVAAPNSDIEDDDVVVVETVDTKDKDAKDAKDDADADQALLHIDPLFRTGFDILNRGKDGVLAWIVSFFGEQSAGGRTRRQKAKRVEQSATPSRQRPLEAYYRVVGKAHAHNEAEATPIRKKLRNRCHARYNRACTVGASSRMNDFTMFAASVTTVLATALPEQAHGFLAHLSAWNADHKYVLFWGTTIVATFMIGSVTVLYLWIASRQVRPRKPGQPKRDTPTSPTTKRLRRNSRSFSELHELERERLEENMLLDRNESLEFSPQLLVKCGPEQRKWVYDTLSKVLTYNKGDEIFARGGHDGSILVVSSGKASLTVHSDDGQEFSRAVEPGDNVVSALPLLVHLINDLQNGKCAPECSKVLGRLSATAQDNNTVLLQIPYSALVTVVQDCPESFLRLAQAALCQVEKITAKSLVDHFGLVSQLLEPKPLVPQLIKADDGTTHAASDKHLDEYINCFAEAIGLEDIDLQASLKTNAKIIHRDRHHVTEEHAASVSGLYVVVQGRVSVQIGVQNQHVQALEATTGHVIGLAACVAGNHVPFRFVCQDDATMLVWFPLSAVSSLLQIQKVAVNCVRHLVAQYSDLVCTVDSSFDWIHLHGGESLFDRGDVCDSVFTILSGRLRAIQEHVSRGNKVETTSELIRGATLGALDMLAATRSNSSVFAIRDSQISKMARNVFDYVVSAHPNVLIHFTTALAQRFAAHRAPGESAMKTEAGYSGIKTNANYLLSLGSAAEPTKPATGTKAPLPLGTVAVLSLTKMTKLQTFCSHLHQSLSTIAKTETVSSAKANEFLGQQWISKSRLARANLSSWLGDIESSNDLVIYEADAMLTAWTKLCIRQADHILLLCSDVQPPQAFLRDMVGVLQAAWEKKNVAISVVRIREKNWTLAAIEEAMQAAKSDASRTNALKKKLRLLQKRSPMLPRFLLPMEKYEWISYFHNVQMPFREHSADFLRLARRITGNAVGLVLGGGGARGLAHLGVLRALEECGIHVDVVGGTSIGAFIGAIYALHPHDLRLVEKKAEQLSGNLSSVLEKLKDLTLPIASFFNGSRFNGAIREHFYDLGIEDLMLNYFCVSTDIAKSRMSVHRSGYVWKYVRASMSLQGYLPPISEDGSLLLDGGYMNNLPADVMKEEGGVKYILAVDVGSEPRREFFGYGSALSGWWLLWNKLNPFAKTVMVPSMGDVSAALAYVSSEQHKDRIKELCIDLYLRPPVLEYGTLQFDKMEEIIQVGYEHALPRIKQWAARVFAAEPGADLLNTTPDTIPDMDLS